MAIEHDGKKYKLVKKYQRYEWSPAKDMLLTKRYGQGMKVKELARKFKTSESVIARRLRVLDLAGEKLWTAENDAILRTGYQQMSNGELARKIGCAVLYVSDRLMYLGLRRHQKI